MEEGEKSALVRIAGHQGARNKARAERPRTGKSFLAGERSAMAWKIHNPLGVIALSSQLNAKKRIVSRIEIRVSSKPVPCNLVSPTP